MAVNFLQGGTMANDPGHAVRFLRSRGTGEHVLQSTHRRVSVGMPDGTEVIQFMFDASKGAAEVRKVIQRERKRHDLPPLTEEEMEREVTRALENVVTITNPTVNASLSIDIERYKLALLKVAYELACIWLGDAYLDDPTAAIIRDVLCERQDLKNADLEHNLDFTVFHPNLSFWATETDSLVAYSFATEGKIYVAIKVFSAMSGVVVVTCNSAAFPAGEHQSPETSSFLHIDAKTKTMRETSLLTEFARMKAADVQ